MKIDKFVLVEKYFEIDKFKASSKKIMENVYFEKLKHQINLSLNFIFH